MHLLHVYVHGFSAQDPYSHYPPNTKLPTVCLADRTAHTAAPKLKYSSLIRGLQHMIYFDSPTPAVENIHGSFYVMETEYSYSSICYIPPPPPPCALSLILGASATKWLDRLGLQRITTLQSPLSPFHLGSVYMLD